MTDKSRKLQSLLNSQVGKGGLRNIVAAVQSYDNSWDFVGAAQALARFRWCQCSGALWRSGFVSDCSRAGGVEKI